MKNRAQSLQAPRYDIDFYADAVVRDPLPHYTRMRALGPVVYLPRHGCYALTRHAEVRAALRNHADFISGSGVAGDAFGCTFLQGNTVASDEPRHSCLRRAMAPPLLPGALSDIREAVQRAADALIEDLLARDGFDAVADLARHLPLQIVRDMVGLPAFGRDHMLKWAAAAFDVLGCQNSRGRAALPVIQAMRRFIETTATRENLKPGSWTHRIHELVDAGLLDPELAPFAIRDYINPSLDTTISATAQMIWQLARNPGAWKALKCNPGLTGNAVNEAVRLGSPIRAFSRHTSKRVTVGGTTVPGGARVLMVFASANRDERAFPNPDRFDLSRNPKDHLGFGSGIHMCVGMHLAQLEMEALLHAMMPRVARIEVGEPEVAMNNTIAAFSRLPAKFRAETRRIARRQAPAAPRSQQLLRGRVAARTEVARDIMCLDIEPSPGTVFPDAGAGAHIDVFIAPGMVRQYSLTGAITTGRYRIAIQKDAHSTGGSVAAFGKYRTGSAITIGRPRNRFGLTRRPGPVLLFAGGIGLTPLWAMAWELQHAGRDFHLHLSVRSPERLAFAGEIAAAPFADRIQIYFDQPGDAAPAARPLDAQRLIRAAGPEVQIYLCGPSGYMRHVRDAAAAACVPAEQVHTEYFGAEIDTQGAAFTLRARRSGREFTVGPHDTMLEVLSRAGIAVETSCQSGVCGSCLTGVVDGTPDHRDMVQTDAEKASNRQVAVCCSRSKSRVLVLDI